MELTHHGHFSPGGFVNPARNENMRAGCTGHLQRGDYVGIGYSGGGNVRVYEHGAPALRQIGGENIGLEFAALD